MIIIVGLGNPGKKYEKTRHNLGFRVVNEFAKENNLPDFKLKKKFLAEIKEGKIAGEKIILAKPQTFMNNSGKAIKLLVTGYSLPVTNLWVIHDDIDLPLGEIKIIKNRSSAGHKGVQSIIDELGSKNFVRFRIGTQPTTYNLQLTTLEDLVLQKFNKEEEKILKEVIERTCQAIKMTIKEGVEKAMNEFNQ
jgi:PTH1 family peptidyl-tRNA hydrolase